MQGNENPFDDPEFQAEMRRRGVVHKPGLAADLLAEIAPLLKAEGIDLDDPNPCFDLDTLNAAMGRAVEQRNLALMTPIGKDREQSMQVMLEVANALLRGDLPAVRAILDSIRPEPTKSRPAASHVIGAGLGLIDSSFSSNDLAPVLARTRVPKWPGAAKRIAADLKVLGAQGRAFDTQHSIIMRHGGEMLMHGVLLLIAAAVTTVADQLDLSTADAFARIRQAKRGGEPQVASAADESAFVEAFAQWRIEQLEEDEEEAGAAAALLEGFAALVSINHLDLHDAEDFEAVLECLAEIDDDQIFDDALAVVHDYSHFRMQEDLFGEDWAGACALIAQYEDDDNDDPALAAVLHAIEETEEQSFEEMAEALKKLRPVEAIVHLLEWIGQSKAVTATGGVKRGDIEAVAAMIGVNAVGVAKLPEYTPGQGEGEVQYAQSMWHVRQLATWWWALIQTEIIEADRGKVRAGAAIAAVPANPGDAISWREPYVPVELCIRLVADIILQNIDSEPATHWRAARTRDLAQAVIPQIALTLTDEGLDLEETRVEGEYGADPEANERLMRARIVQNITEIRVNELSQFELLEVKGSVYRVPEAIRGVVARGILGALAELSGIIDAFDDLDLD